MKRRLKTWEQFAKEFKPLSDKWGDWHEWYEWEDGNKIIEIFYNNMTWHITLTMKDLFGTEVEVKEIKDINYTHVGVDGNYWYWHEDWFEPEFKEIEFISKEEIEI